MAKTKFAEFLGISKGRVSQLIKDGLPVEPNGMIDSEAGKTWYSAHCSPNRRKALTENIPTSARAELDAVRVERAKLDLEREKGNLIDRMAAKQAIFSRARAERDAWIGWASRASVALASELEADPKDAFALMDKLVRDHLADLAELPLKELADD
ncbi:hypothetical protein [Cohaesibacter marisflavi]|nr:hypothetical protein [Cohaesibacter marisflavi]